MSDSEESGITYTAVSSPYEDLSDIGSPLRPDDHEFYHEPPYMLETRTSSRSSGTTSSASMSWPQRAEQSPPPSLDYGSRWNGPFEEDRIYMDIDEEDEDDEMDDEEAEEEHSAPAYPVVVALPATVPSAEETEPFETDEPLPVPPWSDSDVADILAILPTTSPLSPGLHHQPTNSLP
ncbi:hypothetical protein Tco_0452150 [Tanacetum coccineum]